MYQRSPRPGDLVGYIGLNRRGRVLGIENGQYIVQWNYYDQWIGSYEEEELFVIDEEVKPCIVVIS